MVHFCKLPLAGPFCFSIILYNEPPSGSMKITTNEYINAKIKGIKSYRFKAFQDTRLPHASGYPGSPLLPLRLGCRAVLFEAVRSTYQELCHWAGGVSILG